MSERTALTFRGVGIVKKKDAGTLDNGTAYRVYEVAFEDCRRRFRLTVEQFQTAPEAGTMVEMSGHIETDAKGQDTWVISSLARPEFGPVGGNPLADALKRKAS